MEHHIAETVPALIFLYNSIVTTYGNLSSIIVIGPLFCGVLYLIDTFNLTNTSKSPFDED